MGFAAYRNVPLTPDDVRVFVGEHGVRGVDGFGLGANEAHGRECFISDCYVIRGLLLFFAHGLLLRSWLFMLN
jgi:hypothetical protein